MVHNLAGLIISVLLYDNNMNTVEWLIQVDNIFTSIMICHQVVQDKRSPSNAVLDSIHSVGRVLQKNAQLSFLSLSKCHISVTGAVALVDKYIRPHDGLRGLDLSHNPFGTEEDKVEAIAEGLLVCLCMHA